MPANEIIPGIWLGNREASQDETFIRSKNINVVFNCTKDLPFSPYIETKYRVPVDDNLRDEEIRNMATWSSEITFHIMKHHMRGDRILIHCMAGMQRSAAATAMFLILKNEWKTPETIHFIRSKRPIAFNPSANFLPAIEYFEKYAHKTLIPMIHKKEIRMDNL